MPDKLEPTIAVFKAEWHDRVLYRYVNIEP
jgi:hypothetical protein